MVSKPGLNVPVICTPGICGQPVMGLSPFAMYASTGQLIRQLMIYGKICLTTFSGSGGRPSSRELDRESKKRIQSGRKLPGRSEEHTSELQSLMRTSYAVFCLKKKTT